MITVAIADDHQLYRDGLKLLFKKEKHYTLVGEAANGKELLEICKENLPDIILVDVKMPVVDGIQFTKEFMAINPTANIIALSMFEEEALVIDILEAGAMGYLLKDADRDEILESIELVLSGKPCYSRTFSPRIIRLLAKSKFNPHNGKLIELNEKELQIIDCLMLDMTSKEIAEKTGSSVRTVEWNKKKLMEKMDAKSTVGIIIYALKHNLAKL